MVAGEPAQVVIRLDHHHPALERLDPSTAFLYTPHTVTALLLGLALLAYHGGVFCGGASAGSGGSAANAEAGVWAAILVFLGYSVVQGPSTSMVRPHPAVWRLVHGCAVVYVLLLVWLLFQTADDARQFLKRLSPSLGAAVQYRDYGTSCSLVDRRTGGVAWSNIRSTLLDEFVVAHSLGWWAKALLIRNTALLWVYSVGFELMELTFAHMLPNFNECWWDSWVLDVAVCNCLGIYAGMATVRWLDCRYTAYNWQGISELRGLVPRARRGLAQLLPYSWSKLDWMVFSSPKRCLQSLVVVGAFLAVELNVFFLKFALWVPPTNPLNTARLLLWVAVGAPAVREYYEHIEQDRQQQQQQPQQCQAAAWPASRGRLGTFAWLAAAMLHLETMVSVKFGRGLYPKPWPRRVLVSWAVASSLFAGLMGAWQLQRWLAERQRRRQLGREKAA